MFQKSVCVRSTASHWDLEQAVRDASRFSFLLTKADARGIPDP